MFTFDWLGFGWWWELELGLGHDGGKSGAFLRIQRTGWWICVCVCICVCDWLLMASQDLEPPCRY